MKRFILLAVLSIVVSTFAKNLIEIDYPDEDDSENAENLPKFEYQNMVGDNNTACGILQPMSALLMPSLTLLWNNNL